MKFVHALILSLFAGTLMASNSWAGGSDQDQGLSCAMRVQQEISLLEQKPHLTKVGVGVDSGIFVGSVFAFVPTMGASLPLGASAIVGRNVIRSVHRDVSIGSKQWVLQLIADSNRILQKTQQQPIETQNFAALKSLWFRVDNPLMPHYSLEQVARAVIVATVDEAFCKDPSNFRQVHFKDYVLRELASTVRS
ncbi:MAG: hypothetical protein COB04_05680 [Gammaproteobacteria bacterium]|nr:MAG: hypothetical protein COB04_05680 [Gammaproteobacteria bacterium]